MGSRAPVIAPETSSIFRVPPPLSEGLAVIEERVKGARVVALLLDFDGTLAEIAPNPEGARLHPGIRDSLLALSRKTLVAVISGRALDDLCGRVGLGNLLYAGCHGFEIRGPGIQFTEPAAKREVPELKRLASRLKERLQGLAGVEVEDKGMSISVHFRRVAELDRQEVREAVQTEVIRSTRRLQIRQGKEVWEILAAVDWNKGRAARWILDSTGNRDALPLYIGDDITDEDAFRELQDGITIRVGEPAASAAAWAAAGPAEVHIFLGWLESRLP